MTQTQAILALAVSVTVLLVFLGKMLQQAYRMVRRIEDAIGPDEGGKTLRKNVEELKGALNNGIRTDIRAAVDHAGEARRLAGKAAASAATAEQMANEALRATNALRAGVDAMTNAALTDHAGLWDALSELGIDRREDPRPRPSL